MPTCFLAHDGEASTTQLKEWAYAGREHRHWHYWNLKRALLSLGAEQIGFAQARGAPAIWALDPLYRKPLEIGAEKIQRNPN
jgi:hypothetical protein